MVKKVSDEQDKGDAREQSLWVQFQALQGTVGQHRAIVAQLEMRLNDVIREVDEIRKTMVVKKEVKKDAAR